MKPTTQQIIDTYGRTQSLSDTIQMVLSNCSDFGSSNGLLISNKAFPEVEQAIIELMRIAFLSGKDSCNCNDDYWPTDDGFEDFINEFKSRI